MDQNQIDKLRIQIRAKYEVKIEEIKKEMAADLDALARLEPTLRNLTERSEDKKGLGLVPLVGQSRFLKREGKPSIRKLFKVTLEKMNGNFIREALYQKINEEAGEEIKRGSFGAVFAEFVKKKKIVAVEKSSGSKAGLYKKGELIN